MFRSLLLLTILTSVVAHVVEERRLIRSGVPRSRVRRQRSPTLVRDPLSVLSWRTIRGGGDSSSSRLEISKEWCTYIQNIDASNRTFYYQDAQDEIQGPFTRQELKNWRSQLPMDLPIMLQPEKIKAGSSVTLLAHLLEDEQLYNMWRMDVNDGSRDPENCGYCVSPTADEYQEEVNAQIAARTASSAGAYGGLGSVVSAEDGKGFYWQDVNGGWQGPFTEGVLENWKEHLPMDAALWLWDGEKFSEQPVEYAVVVGESHYLRHWRSRNPQMDPEVAGYGRGPTIGDYSRRMSLQNKEELEKMRKIVKKKQQQELEQERKAGGANKTVKTRDQLILQQFAGCLDENDPARIAFLADPEMKEFDRKKKELVDMDGYYERPAHEEKMPDDARRQILEKQAEESREKWKYTNFGDNLIVDRDQEIEDRNLCVTSDGGSQRGGLRERERERERERIQYNTAVLFASKMRAAFVYLLHHRDDISDEGTGSMVYGSIPVQSPPRWTTHTSTEEGRCLDLQSSSSRSENAK